MNKSVTRRFGILTAGGDCPGLNAAIRGVCLSAHNHYDMEIIGIYNGFEGLIEENIRLLRPDDYSEIITKGGTILGSSREKPFEMTDKAGEPSEKVAAIKKTYNKLGLDCIVALGGNGTNTTAYKLSREGLNIIGLPKTIDNDIVGTDITFGFYSALDVGTEAIDRLQTTAQSHNRIIVVELMGHKAGWLSLYAGIAGGCDAILIPEIPYDINIVTRHLVERAKNGKEYSIVVVAEGALSVAESQMEKKELKKFRQENPSVCRHVTSEIHARTSMEIRDTVLGYVQRGGSPSSYDRTLATALGAAAAKLLARGDYGRMVAMVGNEISSVDLSVPESKVKNVPLDHFMVETARDAGICLGDK